MKVKGLISKNTIVLHPSEGEAININKGSNELLFLEVADIIERGDLDELLEKYLDIKSKIEKFSLNLFTVDTIKGQMFLKGDETPMPELMVEKLLELEQEGVDFMPLIRFWKKLKQNPSDASINQLYGFMVHNGIGLTEAGDIVVEKGVDAKGGKLVDKRTGTMDNSIGEVVEMSRDKVDANPEQTCSFGLHVGAPEHVRSHYSGIIVKCAVNPIDVVAVPNDYNNTKMRVCKYTVLGYSDEHTSHKPIFKLSDFVTLPTKEVKKKLEDSKPTRTLTDGLSEDTDVVINLITPVLSKEKGDDFVEVARLILVTMTSQAMLDYIKENTGVLLPYNVKSKATILRRGSELLAKYLETENKE